MKYPKAGERWLYQWPDHTKQCFVAEIKEIDFEDHFRGIVVQTIADDYRSRLGTGTSDFFSEISSGNWIYLPGQEKSK